MPDTTYTIDGAAFSTLEEFYDAFEVAVLRDVEWGRNLDAFNDVLRGGFGTPAGFTVVWTNAALSRERLGYPETARQLQARLMRCHPSNRPAVERQLDDARNGRGPTVFDWLVEILEDHGPSGTQQTDNVVLVLRD